MNDIDLLHREKDIRNVVNLIESASLRKEKLSFAIDGKWGSGKTFFINLLLKQLEDKYFVFKYDSWDNDFYEDPLIGLMDTIKDELNKINFEKRMLHEASKKIIKNIVKAMEAFLDNIITNKTGICLSRAVKQVKSFWKECAEQSMINDDFNPYNKIKTSKQLIIGSMNELSKIKPVLFIVDEIDRCLPTYTLKVIERIHHISENVDNCITIFSVDTHQLQRIIELVYNKEDDTVKGYLRKVIDFTYSINNGQLDNNFYSELEDYRKRFGDPIDGITEEDLKTFVLTLFNDVEMRTVYKILKNAKYTHDLVFSNEKLSAELMCAELMMSWAVKEYGDDIVNKIKFNILNPNQNSKQFIKYMAEPKRNYYLTYYVHQMERSYVNIINLQSLVAYFVIKDNTYYPALNGNIKNIPSYLNRFLNGYVNSLNIIKL